MRCLRKILRIPYTAHRTNESVKLEIVNSIGDQETLMSHIKKKKLKWFGHVSRHEGNLDLAYTIMHGSVPGKRSQGRPRLNWFNNISRWTGQSVYKAKTLTADRNEWRQVIVEQMVHLRPP